MGKPLQADQLVLLSLIPPGWLFTVCPYLSFSSILVLDWTAEDLSILGGHVLGFLISQLVTEVPVLKLALVLGPVV